MPIEADNRRKFVVPLLQAAGWNNDPHSIAEQRWFTQGRIVVRGNQAERRRGKRADCLLHNAHDFPIAVVEPKAEYKKPVDGLQQAKGYAESLGLKFAYTTNERETTESDFITRLEPAIQAILLGKPRLLLTMATNTDKPERLASTPQSREQIPKAARCNVEMPSLLSMN